MKFDTIKIKYFTLFIRKNDFKNKNIIREKQHLDSAELIDRLDGSDASISRHEGVEKFIFAKSIFKKWRHSVSVTRGVLCPLELSGSIVSLATV